MRRRRDARELELAEKVAAARHLALTLVYLDEHTRLVVRVSGKISDILHGTVMLRLMRTVICPPMERGVTSSRRSWVVSDVSPLRMAAWIIASAE